METEKNLLIDSISELTAGIQSEVEISELSRKAIDACMSSLGISSGVFFSREYSNNKRYNLQFSRGVRILRNISLDDSSIEFFEYPDYDLFNLINTEQILPYIQSKNSKVIESFKQLPFAHFISSNSIHYGILFLGQKISGNPLSYEDKKVIRTIIKTTAMSIQIHFQMIELKEKIMEVNTLKDAALDVSSTLDMKTLSLKSYINLNGLIHPLGGVVLLNTGYENTFEVLRADRPIAPRKQNHSIAKLPNEFIQYFLNNPKTYYTKNEISINQLHICSELFPNLNWNELHLFIPLIVDNILINLYAFGLSSDGKNYDSKNFDIITAFVLQARTSFQNAMLFQKEEKLRLRFQKYVPKQIIEDAFNDTDSIGEGIEKKVVILFSDIRGFTTFCENKKPSEVVVLLNEYFDIMLDAIDSTNGILDKLIGDAIMATWGIFDDNSDNVYNAAFSSIKMINALNKFNSERPVEKQIQIGIGLHYGEVKAGNIGGAKRSDFTIIGDSVNLASRLEGVTKQYGVNIIVSEDFYFPIKDKFIFRELDVIRVKGKNEPVKIYQLVDFIPILL